MIIVLNILHLIFVFFPIFIYLIPINYIKKSFKYIFLILILTPMHWVFLENQCLITTITKHLGNLKNTETKSGFSEKYLKWLYEPVMNIIGWKWNDSGLDKMVNLHWIFNFILLWYFLFFVGRKELIN